MMLEIIPPPPPELPPPEVVASETLADPSYMVVANKIIGIIIRRIVAIPINVGIRFSKTACPQRPFRLSFAWRFNSAEDCMIFPSFSLITPIYHVSKNISVIMFFFFLLFIKKG